MFCKYCGKESETEVCEECKKTHSEDTIEVEATKVESNTTSTTAVPKSKIVAGLLGIFLGYLGIHNFYLGYKEKAIGQLLLTLVGWIACGIGPVAASIWGLIEGILILTGSMDKDADGNPLKD